MKIALLLILPLFVLILSGCDQNIDNAVSRPTVKKPTLKITELPVITNHDTVCIAAVGDIMLGTAYPNTNQLPPDSARNSFSSCLKDLRDADVTFGNLEGTLADTGSARKKKDQSIAHFFRMPTNYGQVIKDAGFDVLSIANNHIGDFGDSGKVRTVKALESYGFHYAGLLSCPSTVFTINGVRYGFCAFAPNASVVPILDLKNEARLISDLKQRCDILIVSFHGGAEGAAFEHVPFQCESYVGEKRGDVHLFAHTAIDAGADLVLGNGPHVSRAMENYKNRLIAYSLGNFCTYKDVSVSGVCGLAPLLKVRLNKKGEFLDGRIIAFKQTHADGLVRDTLNKVVARIKNLTETDFPASGLKISNDGMIVPDEVR